MLNRYLPRIRKRLNRVIEESVEKLSIGSNRLKKESEKGNDEKQNNKEPPKKPTADSDDTEQILPVWGFVSKETSEEIIKDTEELWNATPSRLSMSQILGNFGYDMKEFESGCTLAYRRLAELYEEGEPKFVSQYQDIVEPNLGEKLDDQLRGFQKNNLLPRINCKKVKPRVISILTSPKTEILNKFSFLPYSLQGMLGVYLLFFKPEHTEILISVEFSVRERFELIPKELIKDQPPHNYVDDFMKRLSKEPAQTVVAPQQVVVDIPPSGQVIVDIPPPPIVDTPPILENEDEELKNNSKDGEDSLGEARKHLFLFSADYAPKVGEVSLMLQKNLEFKVSNINSLSLNSLGTIQRS